MSRGTVIAGAVVMLCERHKCLFLDLWTAKTFMGPVCIPTVLCSGLSAVRHVCLVGRVGLGVTRMIDGLATVLGWDGSPNKWWRIVGCMMPQRPKTRECVPLKYQTYTVTSRLCQCPSSASLVFPFTVQSAVVGGRIAVSGHPTPVGWRRSLLGRCSAARARVTSRVRGRCDVGHGSGPPRSVQYRSANIRGARGPPLTPARLARAPLCAFATWTPPAFPRTVLPPSVAQLSGRAFSRGPKGTEFRPDAAEPPAQRRPSGTHQGGRAL